MFFRFSFASLGSFGPNEVVAAGCADVPDHFARITPLAVLTRLVADLVARSPLRRSYGVRCSHVPDE